MIALTRRLVLGAAAGGVLAAPARAALAPDLRARIVEILKARRVPGAAVALVKDGATLAAEGFGLASIPFSAPVTSHSLFHLGSVSKQFTAATVVALAREGRIRLTDPVGQHARDLPAVLGERPIHALLSHTSGIPDYEGLPGFEADRAISRTDFVKAVAAKPQDFAPGEAWAYSNSAYVLLGHLIADVTGQTYHQAVEARLLRPAALAAARFDDATAIIPGRVEPYTMDGEAVRHALQMDSDYSGWPDGGLLMSADDAGRWEAGLQSGRPIPPADLRRMTTPAILSTGRSAAYGYGWFTDRVRGRELHYHSGSVPGFLCFYIRAPATRTGALVMVNMESGRAGIAMREICQLLVESAAPGATASSLSPIRDDAPDLTRRARALITRNGGAAVDAAQLAPELSRPGMAAAVPARGALGPPKAFALVEAFDEVRGAHVRRYRATFADRQEHFAFGYAPDGRVFRVRAV